MIVEKDLLGKVRLYFGLNLYEVRIWTALLSRGTSSAGELSDISNVPRSRSYDILTSLEEKGFIVQKAGKPLRYEAIPPAEVVGRVRVHMKSAAEKEARKLESLRQGKVVLARKGKKEPLEWSDKDFAELRHLYDEGKQLIEPHEMSGAMRGRENLHHHLTHSVKNAKKSVTLMTTESGLKRKAELLMPIFEDLSRKGVKVRIAAPITKSTADIVKELSRVADVRHISNPARFCMVDGREVTFMVNHDDDVHSAYDVGIWAHSPFFSETLNGMFELAWSGMKSGKKH